MPAAPIVLVQLWLAKKIAVLLAVRVYGLKKLYRGGLRLNNRYVTDPTVNRRVHSVLHKVAAGAMLMSESIEGPARRYMNKIVFGTSEWPKAGPKT